MHGRISCNLSPRGDGNLGDKAAQDRMTVAIYPREGTETQLSACW